MSIHDFAESRKRSLRRVFDFTSDANPLGPSNKAKHAVRQEVSRIEVPPDEKARFLRAYLCRTEKIRDDQIVFGAGSTHLLNLLLQVVRPGLAGLLSPPSTRLMEILKGRRVNISPIPLLPGDNGFSIPVNTLCDHLNKVDMLIISNPHDMTGASIPREDMGLLINEADRLGKTLVIDESLRDYTTLESPVAEATASRSTIILRTFSFYHALAGLRLGYGIGPTRLVSEIDAMGPSLQLNSLAPRAALFSLRDREYRKRTLKCIADEKEYLTSKLSVLDGVGLLDTPCNFILLSLREEWESLYRSFKDQNILVDGFTGGDGRTYIRVPVGRHKSNAHFLRAVRRIRGG